MVAEKRKNPGYIPSLQMHQKQKFSMTEQLYSKWHDIKGCHKKKEPVAGSTPFAWKLLFGRFLLKLAGSCAPIHSIGKFGLIALNIG